MYYQYIEKLINYILLCLSYPENKMLIKQQLQLQYRGTFSYINIAFHSNYVNYIIKAP